jgi:RNase P subunit RPR2
MAWEKTGTKYLKTGDESGHLCYQCDYPMIIVKKGVVRKWSKGKKRIEWSIRCQCCGKEIPTCQVRYIGAAEVYV